MRIFALILLAVTVLLQFRLWLSNDGVREVKRLEVNVEAQKRENSELKARNEQLAAEVQDLKEGLEAVEERARSDLGMIGSNETFYQVVDPEPSARQANEAQDEPESRPRPPPTHQASAK